MAAKRDAHGIDSEIANHLVESMGAAPAPAPPSLNMAPISAQGLAWPDAKAKHPKEQGTGHGRVGQQAAVTAVHRTSRPQMPHSS
ncbi:hypothetical protein AB6813_20450 [bacterium RCC_150]